MYATRVHFWYAAEDHREEDHTDLDQHNAVDVVAAPVNLVDGRTRDMIQSPVELLFSFGEKVYNFIFHLYSIL